MHAFTRHVFTPHADYHLTLLGELDGIAQEVDQDLPQAGYVAHDGRWNIPCDLTGQLQALLGGLELHQVQRRLDALAKVEGLLLQAASVQGERFAAEATARVLGWGEEAAVQRLSGPLRTRHRLVEAVSLDRLAASGQRPSASSGQRLSRYRFRHGLVQGSAYRSLDAVERARLHEATGRALEAVYAAEEESPPALAPELAWHFEAAGLSLEAARYRLGAGRWAARLIAYDEAIAHLERGLALLDGVAASPERLRLELGLYVALAVPAAASQGWQASVLRQALGRLSDLAQHPDLQDDPQRLVALTVLALASAWSADPERAQRLGEQLLDLAHEGDRQCVMLAHWALGHSHWLQGQPVVAREHLSQAMALHDQEIGRRLGLLFGDQPGVTVRVELGAVLWLLGYPDQGRNSLRQALAQAQEIEQPSAAALAHVMAAGLYAVLARDVAKALEHAQAVQALGKAGRLYGAWGDLLTRQAGAAGPESEPKQDSMQEPEGGFALQTMDTGVGYGAQLLVQAQMLAMAGRPKTGLEAMDRALAWIERSGVRVLEAEVWRMRGELLLMADGPDRSGVDEAGACFRRALEVARQQQARWLDLRAAASLARLWQAQGRHDEARELLAGIYGWFTEGFDTVDLVEAKALLEELQ